LNDLGISYTVQFRLRSERGVRRYYDFLFPELRIVLEVNGDYWHGNPLLYKSGDIINSVYGKIKVDVLWEKDRKKREFAENRGYRVIYLWESEMKGKTDEEVLAVFKSRILEGLYE
jgi:G:T-mismatch repair DNA endonuclease (very short patch repair protein)